MNACKGDDFIQTTIQKWRNSQGIRTPKALEMIENDIAELNRINDNIVIRKMKEKKELTLEDIFKDYDRESVAEEFGWGAPAGKEVW